MSHFHCLLVYVKSVVTEYRETWLVQKALEIPTLLTLSCVKVNKHNSEVVFPKIQKGTKMEGLSKE